MKHTNYPSITKFQQLVELKDYRKPTKKEYVRYVRKLAEHFQCDPATLTENQLREYFLFLRQHKHYSRSPMKMAKYALLCFYVECLKVTGWTVFREVRIAEPQVLPIVLSRAEVKGAPGRRARAALPRPAWASCTTAVCAWAKPSASRSKTSSAARTRPGCWSAEAPRAPAAFAPARRGRYCVLPHSRRGLLFLSSPPPNHPQTIFP